MDKEMEKAVLKRLDELRVHLQADGGDLQVVSVEGKTVNLSLHGACGCCPHASMTIKDGIQRIIREEFDPEIVINRVEA